MECSKPEPPPKDYGVETTPILLNWLLSLNDVNRDDIILAIKLIKARDTYGFNKYGQHLKTKDGRDSQEDAIQEFGDLMQYILKAKLNGESIDKIKKLLPILEKLINISF